MPERDPARPEQSRRRLILAVSLGAVALGMGCTIPGWLHGHDHTATMLAFQALPLVSASAFLAGLCVGVPALCPWSRLPPLGALTLPAIHTALTVAIANILATRPSAMLEPLRAQKQIIVWLDPKLWGTAFVVEFLVFLTASALFVGRGPSSG